VLCCIPYTKLWYKHFPAFLEACKNAGVKHFVKLSFYHARVPGDRFKSVALVREHGDCDEMLIKTIKPEKMVVPVMGADLADVGLDMGLPNMSYVCLRLLDLNRTPPLTKASLVAKGTRFYMPAITCRTPSFFKQRSFVKRLQHRLFFMVLVETVG